MSMFRKSGGIVGVISDTQWKISTFESKKSGEEYSKLSFNFNFTIDGATEPQQRFVDAGFLMEGTTVSEDGKTLVNDEVEGGVIHEDTEFARFINSMIANGFSEANLDASGRNYEGIEGTRVQLTFWTDKEKTAKLGQRIAKKGKYKGKGFDYQEVRVNKVYDAEAAPATKPAAKAAPAKAATKKSAPVVQDTERADNVIVEILADAKDNTISRTSLSAAVVKYALKNKLASEERDALRGQLTDEGYLAAATERGVIMYDAKGKGQPIYLSQVAA